MTLAFDSPTCAESLLSRLDPRWKLAGLVLFAVAASLLTCLPAALAGLLAALALVLVSGVSWRWFLGRIGALGVVLLLFVILLPFIVPDPRPGIDLGPVELSRRGVSLAALICLKALTVVTLMLVVLATAPLDATLKAAHALRVPGLLIQIAVLSYRYLFLLREELGRLLVALRVRGYRLRPHPQRYRMMGHLTGIVLVRGYERAERVGQAMRCRGFDGRFRSLAGFATRPLDVVFFLLLAAAAAGLLIWNFLPR